jgi:cupin superfamily acireductone dioxygenase involved in methionine salvage
MNKVLNLVIMKRIFLTIVFLGYQLTGMNAQDIITKTSGDDIRAKVTVINADEVKYKLFNNQSGPTFAISVYEVFMIKYENGSKDIFKPVNGKIEIQHIAPEKKQPEPQPSPQPQPQPPYNNDTAGQTPTPGEPVKPPTPTPTPPTEPKKNDARQQDNSKKQAATSETKKVIPTEPTEPEETTTLTKLPDSETAIEKPEIMPKIDSAVVRIESHSVRSVPSPYYNVQTRIYKWTTSFKEMGGKLGFKLQATDYYIVSPSGQKYTNNWSTNVDVKKHGKESVSYCVSSNGQWDEGCFHAVWVGKDDGGNDIKIEQEIELKIKN